MQKTLARIQFKKHLGQANHFLITSLIALDTLDKSGIFEAPSELRRAWNPKDRHASIVRSRNFVLQSFLGRAVDSIDMYFGLLNRKPDYLQSPALSLALSKADRSVSKRMNAFATHYGVSDIARALIDVLITWRNNVFHELAENTLRPENRQVLLDKGSEIAEEYRGLDVSELAAKAEKGSPLTFKETASLINSSHNFVKELDEKVLEACDQQRFCREVVEDALARKESGFYAKYFGLTEERRDGFLRNWFANEYGLADIEDALIKTCIEVGPRVRLKPAL